jgi:hypothetical protein
MFKGFMTVAITTLLVGCGNLNSVYRDFEVDKGVGAMVDIKQRAVIASTRVDKDSRDGNVIKTRTVVCAEPSPDALSAYAAEFSAKADTPGKTSAQLAAAFQESAAFVGLRTQSIQLLRDAMYRMCEAYMSGGLDETQYQLLLRRFQKNMVALLAVEQLTGAIRVPPVTINTQGQAEAAKSLSSMTEQIKKTDEEIAALDKKIQEATTALENANAAEKPGLEADITKLKADMKALEADKAALEKSRTETRDLVASGSATATVNLAQMPGNRSDAHIHAVSGTVEKIALRVLDTDDIGALCWANLMKEKSNTGPLAETCKDYFKTANQSQVINNDLTRLYIETQTAILNEQKSTKPDQKKLKALLEALNGIEKQLGQHGTTTPTAPVVQGKPRYVETLGM